MKCQPCERNPYTTDHTTHIIANSALNITSVDAGRKNGCQAGTTHTIISQSRPVTFNRNTQKKNVTAKNTIVESTFSQAIPRQNSYNSQIRISIDLFRLFLDSFLSFFRYAPKRIKKTAVAKRELIKV